MLLDALHALLDQLESLLREGQGKQIVEMSAEGSAPAQMLRNENRLDPLDEREQPRQVGFGHAFGGTEPKPDAMQAYREMGAYALKHMAIVSTCAEIVLAVHLDPADRGPRAEELGVMPGAQPDASAKPQRVSQPFFSLASLPGSPGVRLPPSCRQVPVLTFLNSSGS